jgi:hypothetical protein
VEREQFVITSTEVGTGALSVRAVTEIGEQATALAGVRSS